jgi:hypothetical protein
VAFESKQSGGRVTALRPQSQTHGLANSRYFLYHQTEHW